MDTQTVDIDAMEAGREMDALVAKRVMGWTLTHMEADHPSGGYMAAVSPDGEAQFLFYVKPDVYSGRIPWQPSTDIAAAFQVVEHLCADRFYFKTTYKWSADYGCWAAFDDKGVSDPHPLYRARATTLPLAICKAALKAVQAQEATQHG